VHVPLLNRALDIALNRALDIAPLSGNEWLFCVAMASIVLLVAELKKL
jgi:hypothetical protein